MLLESNKIGAAASESAVCSRIGVDFIKNGGNAADAMVGTVFCIGVIGMYHSDMGDAGFMLVRGSNASYTFVDFRETAPAATIENVYINDNSLSLFGDLASYTSPRRLRDLTPLHRRSAAAFQEKFVGWSISTSILANYLGPRSCNRPSTGPAMASKSLRSSSAT